MDMLYSDESFFLYKNDLKKFSLAVNQLTEEYLKQISEKFSIYVIKCVGLFYDHKRFNVDSNIGKYTAQQIENKKIHGIEIIKKLLIHKRKEIVQYDKLIEELKNEGQELIEFLDSYKKDIKKLYQQYAPFLWHISIVSDILMLKPSIQKENMYYNELCDAVFATSNYDEVLLYLGRTSGDEMAVIDNICLYKRKPYSGWDDSKAYLMKKATIYYLDVQMFEPVIDFMITDEGRVRLMFGHEWIAREAIKVQKVEDILAISVKDLEQFQFYYGLKDICLAPYVDVLKQEGNLLKRKECLQDFISQKIIEYIDLKR